GHAARVRRWYRSWWSIPSSWASSSAGATFTGSASNWNPSCGAIPKLRPVRLCTRPPERQIQDKCSCSGGIAMLYLRREASCQAIERVCLPARRAPGGVDDCHRERSSIHELATQTGQRTVPRPCASRTNAHHQVSCLSLGHPPGFDPKPWTLTVLEEVERPLTLTWQELLALLSTTSATALHCV